MPILTLLVARALNGAIGNANQLPWHLPEDLAHFKRTTMGGTIVMGRRTWESIGRVLPGRRMVVITRGTPPLPSGVRRAASLEQAIADNATEEELFIIGGAQLFASALPLADRIVLTEVELAPPGDVFLPMPDPVDWRELSRVASTSVNGTRFSIITFARRLPPATTRPAAPSPAGSLAEGIRPAPRPGPPAGSPPPPGSPPGAQPGLPPVPPGSVSGG